MRAFSSFFVSLFGILRWLFQSILLPRIVAAAFVVLCVCGGIQRKAEFRVKYVKKKVCGVSHKSVLLEHKTSLFILTAPHHTVSSAGS